MYFLSLLWLSLSWRAICFLFFCISQREPMQQNRESFTRGDNRWLLTEIARELLISEASLHRDTASVFF